jgi:ABC-type multidrug transport system permease subunit
MRGSLPLLMLVSLIYVIDVIGMGLLVSVFVNSQISAILIVAVGTLIPAFMYSGFMLPITCLEQNAKYMAYSLPPTHYIDFIRKLMIKGVGMEFLIDDIIVLIIMGFLLYGASIMIFKKRLD